MKNDFEGLYDNIVDLVNDIQSYCMEKFMTCPEEDKEHYNELMAAAGTLHDVAHELEEHLAWD